MPKFKIERAKVPGRNLIGMRDGADHADVRKAFAGLGDHPAEAVYHEAIQLARGGGITPEILLMIHRAEEMLG